MSQGASNSNMLYSILKREKRKEKKKQQTGRYYLKRVPNGGYYVFFN